MRKRNLKKESVFNPLKYSQLRLQSRGFTYIGKSSWDLYNAFQNWESPCTLVGIFNNGDEVIIEEK